MTRFAPHAFLISMLLATVAGASPAAAPAAAPAPGPAASPDRPPVAPPPENEDVQTGTIDEPAPAEPDSVPVDEGLAVVSHDGRTIVFRLKLEGTETWRDLAKRITGDASRAESLGDALGRPALAAGQSLELRWDLVRPEYQYLALRALFPADRFENGAWVHHPADSKLLLPSEGLWQVAAWFTGDGARWQEIARANGMAAPDLAGRKPVRIPVALVLPLFKPVENGSGGLVYAEDADGPYAQYRLARGEALYSGVVMRFTDATRPDDVNNTAEAIRKRTGIEDVRRMDVGQEVRIPLEVLSVPFLPDNHPRRVLARLHEAEIVELAPPTRAEALAGVHVLIDPGHGGADVGALQGSVRESDYVYDLACRVRRRLMEDTSAKVKMLVRDTQHGWKVVDRKDPGRKTRAVVETRPPFPIVRGQTRAALNRRWMLANDVYRDLTENRGVAPEKVVFLSLHADSLHRSMRGATVYVPGERYRRNAEETPTRAARLRDEAVSRRLAWDLLSAYRDDDLPVHENRPVRDHIVRGRRQVWVPAVLRGNMIPAKVLLETINLGNPDDIKLLQVPAGRERIARAIVAGLLRFYSGDDRPLLARKPQPGPS